MSKIEVDTIEPQSGTTVTLGASGDTITVPSGVSVSGLLSNTPTFFAHVSANTSITAGTKTKIEFNTEAFDTDNAYDNSTNYRFTVPSGKAGKYFFNTKVLFTVPEATDLFNRAEVFFYKNGVELGSSYADDRTGYGAQNTVYDSIILDLTESDYVEVYGRFYVQGGTPTVGGGTAYYRSTFLGYKLLG